MKHKKNKGTSKLIYVYDKTGKFVEVSPSLQDFTKDYVKASNPCRQLNQYGVFETKDGYFGATSPIGRVGVRAFKKLKVPVRNLKSPIPVSTLGEKGAVVSKSKKTVVEEPTNDSRVIMYNPLGEKIAVFRWDYAKICSNINQHTLSRLKSAKTIKMRSGITLELKGS